MVSHSRYMSAKDFIETFEICTYRKACINGKTRKLKKQVLGHDTLLMLPRGRQPSDLDLARHFPRVGSVVGPDSGLAILGLVQHCSRHHKPSQ